MNRQYQEKLSHIYDLYSLANLDGSASDQERRYIEKIAEHLGVSSDDLESLQNDTLMLDFTPPRHEYECIPQFHRMLLLLSLHRRWSPQVRAYCRNIALRMGLNLLAVEEVFYLMENQPRQGLTPDQVSKIFKKYYN